MAMLTGRGGVRCHRSHPQHLRLRRRRLQRQQMVRTLLVPVPPPSRPSPHPLRMISAWDSPMSSRYLMMKAVSFAMSVAQLDKTVCAFFLVVSVFSLPGKRVALFLHPSAAPARSVVCVWKLGLLHVVLARAWAEQRLRQRAEPLHPLRLRRVPLRDARRVRRWRLGQVHPGQEREGRGLYVHARSHVQRSLSRVAGASVRERAGGAWVRERAGGGHSCCRITVLFWFVRLSWLPGDGVGVGGAHESPHPSLANGMPHS